MSDQKVLEPYIIGDLLLPNRVVMAPMTRSRADNKQHAPTSGLHVPYYTQRATAGLIITEGCQVSKEAVGYINTPGIYSKEQVKAWKEVTRSVHNAGGRIFIQLWHVGRMSHPDFHEGELPLAPSALNPHEKSYTQDGFKQTVTPKAMTQKDIERTIGDFRKSAQNAMKAGFDGVEIHSSNGYLFHQFFSSTSNKRTDQYGGSIANRARFFFEVLDAIREVMPENRIGARFNPSLHNSFGMKLNADTLPTFDYIISRLDKEYNLAYIHLSEPFNDVTDVAFAEPEIAKRYRPLYGGTLMINSNFDRESANKVIAAGDADLVAFAKLYISNPDLVGRFREGIEPSPWDQSTFYTTGEEGYTDYIAKTRELKPADR